MDAYAAGHHVNISTFNEADYKDDEIYPDFVHLKSHEWSEHGGLVAGVGGGGRGGGGGGGGAESPAIGDIHRQGR